MSLQLIRLNANYINLSCFIMYGYRRGNVRGQDRNRSKDCFACYYYEVIFWILFQLLHLRFHHSVFPVWGKGHELSSTEETDNFSIQVNQKSSSACSDNAENTCRYFRSRKVQSDKSKKRSSNENIIIKNQGY